MVYVTAQAISEVTVQRYETGLGYFSVQLSFHNNIAGTTTQSAISISYITTCRGGGIIATLSVP